MWWDEGNDKIADTVEQDLKSSNETMDNIFKKMEIKKANLQNYNQSIESLIKQINNNLDNEIINPVDSDGLSSFLKIHKQLFDIDVELNVKGVNNENLF